MKKDKQLEEKILDRLDQALVAVRDSTPSSLSKLFSEFRDDIKEIKAQTAKTNGRVTKLERTVLVLITSFSILLIQSYPQVAKIIAFL